MTYAMLFTFAGVLGCAACFRLTNSDLQATKVLVWVPARQARMITGPGAASAGIPALSVTCM